MSSFRISVIIPSYRRPRDLSRCLAALAGQTRLADEICVVVREDDVESRQLLRANRAGLPGLRGVTVQRPGLVAAINQGLEAAAGDILIFTDDDAEATDQWVEAIERWFTTDARVGAVGGRDWIQLAEHDLNDPKPTTEIGQFGLFGRIGGNHHCPCPVRPLEVAVLKGVNMSFRRVALQNRRIDERLRGTGAQVGSEIDLCLPLRRRGWRVIFDASLTVKHYIAARSAGDDRLDFAGDVGRDAVYNIAYLIGKHGNVLQIAGSLLRGTFVGSRWTPGLLALIKWRWKGDRDIIQRYRRQFGCIFSGTIDGIGQRYRGMMETGNEFPANSGRAATPPITGG